MPGIARGGGFSFALFGLVGSIGACLNFIRSGLDGVGVFLREPEGPELNFTEGAGSFEVVAVCGGAMLMFVLFASLSWTTPPLFQGGIFASPSRSGAVVRLLPVSSSPACRN